MTARTSSRQHQILDLLLNNKAGVSIDEIGNTLEISRNAVQQHFVTLERDGYIQASALKKTVDRPVRIFLTEAFKVFLHKLTRSLVQNYLPIF